MTSAYWLTNSTVLSFYHDGHTRSPRAGYVDTRNQLRRVDADCIEILSMLQLWADLEERFSAESARSLTDRKHGKSWRRHQDRCGRGMSGEQRPKGPCVDSLLHELGLRVELVCSAGRFDKPGKFDQRTLRYDAVLLEGEARLLLKGVGMNESDWQTAWSILHNKHKQQLLSGLIRIQREVMQWNSKQKVTALVLTIVRWKAV